MTCEEQKKALSKALLSNSKPALLVRRCAANVPMQRILLIRAAVSSHSGGNGGHGENPKWLAKGDGNKIQAEELPL